MQPSQTDLLEPSLKRLPPKQLALVLVGDYITVYGLRKLAAAARLRVPDVKLYFVATGGRLHSIKNILFSQRSPEVAINEADLEAIASELADADVIGFSTITIDAPWAEKIIAKTREVNPDAYYLWGGVHCIVSPEDAIKHVDGICVGEGDFAFDELLDRMMAGEDFHDVQNFWFKKDGEIVKNGFRPLLTPKQMGERPHPQYALDGEEFIYERGKGFVPISTGHYLDFNGLSYHTLWTHGCPYRCTYCGNTAFLAIDKKYGTIRHPSVDYIVDEVKQAVAKHPHINTIVFDDDCFGALPVPVLQEFADKWREHVGIPFFVAGIIPSYVRREKMEILLSAGMNRMRMGLQSGSDRMLKFFKRPNKPGVLPSATGIVGDYTSYMIPPAYDMIVDAPFETKDDVDQTLRFVYNMPRPFTLNLCSLRVIPGTVLEDQVAELQQDGNIDMDGIDTNYHDTVPNWTNSLLFLTATIRLPKPIFEWALKKAHPVPDDDKRRPLLHFLCRSIFFFKRGLYDLRFMDFSVLPGKVGWLLWKVGFVGFWQKYCVRRFDKQKNSLIGKGEDMNMPVPKTYTASQ